ncbi:hypothetical protein EVJ58_g7981 [Rhodofomes roseus]|uniref:CxC2-like cysteine cluster KDZ transposase-associated domain-containing protein n=1 Tax=Rhodofomes roseus TaxID=34475 RepID=A0A4Y9Y0B8_9APHY|nr:hypothetical protein EVJ58_g7981 [Rhodofomes roseus]
MPFPLSYDYLLMARSKSHRSKYAGSSAVKVRYSQGFGKRVTQARHMLLSLVQRCADLEKKYQGELAGLTFAECDALNEITVDAGDKDSWEDEMQPVLPLGEEAMFFSTAGGEHALWEDFFKDDKTQCYDARTRIDRTLCHIQEWQQQMPRLVDGYLTWKDGIHCHHKDDMQLWDVTFVNFDELRMGVVTPASLDEYPNKSLAHLGYLGTAPVPYNRTLVNQFSIAYDVYLDILRHVKIRVDAALGRNSPDWKMLSVCAPCLYKLEGETPLKYSMLVTMDGNQSLKLVNDIFRAGKTLQDDQTGHSELWLMPADVDRWKDERKSDTVEASDNPSTQLGSASAPINTAHAVSVATPVQVTSAGAAVPSTDPVLVCPPSSSANELSNEPSGGKAAGLSDEADDCNDEFAYLDDAEQDDEKLQGDVVTCVEHWHAAGPEARKKMFKLFAVTGIFVCLCRHGHLLAICDMVRSGELMKYLLAIINRLMDVYGSDILVGYDIACVFARTVAKSSLAQRAKDMRLTGITPAFHGHGHNRGCQVYWHPLYFEGAGKEDFEGCEQCFSASNHIASGTRLTSPFHRCQAIKQFFHHWDNIKHAKSGNFIYNNYHQALAIIAESVEVLKVLCLKLSITKANLERFLSEERQYLRSCKKEPPEVIRKAEYMDALQCLEEAQQEYRKIDYYIIEKGYQGRQISNIHQNRTASARKHQLVDNECRAFEDELDLAYWWTRGTPEYAQAEKDLLMHEYHKAIDNLEQLVIQRLFELTKLRMSGVGYKLREKISKGLKARAEAIKKALARYNKRAAELSPPRAALSWDEVVEMVSLAEFDLLRDARNDICEETWADRKNHEAMNILFSMKCAEEEIARLNIEIPRVLTFMFDEHIDYYHAVSRHIITNPALAHELSRRWEFHNHIHAGILAQF